MTVSFSLDPSGVGLLLGVMTAMIFVPPLEGVELVDGFFFGRRCLEEKLSMEGIFLVSVVVEAAIVRTKAEESCGGFFYR